MESFNELMSSPVGILAIGAIAFVLGSMLFNVKQWEAHWKQWAIDTSKAMSKAGLVHTPKILDALAVGDLAGAFSEIKGLADIFKDPKQLAAEFQTVFENMLDASFKDPTQAKALQQLANDAVSAFASGDPEKSAQALAADAQAAFAANPLFASMAQNGLHLPALSLVPQIAANPALANIAGVLGNAGLAHLFPLVAAGAQSVQPAASDVASAPAAGTSLPAVPAGHVVTIAGPAATSAPPASASAAA